MMEIMITPTTRAEFERHFNILREQICKGKYHIAHGMETGLEKVRYLPNGRIDFLSVNESARLQANMANQFQSKWLKEMDESQGDHEGPKDDVPKE
jgi:hypothetical protein